MTGTTGVDRYSVKVSDRVLYSCFIAHAVFSYNNARKKAGRRVTLFYKRRKTKFANIIIMAFQNGTILVNRPLIYCNVMYCMYCMIV